MTSEVLWCPETWYEAHKVILEHETINARGKSLANTYATWNGKGNVPQSALTWGDPQVYAQ